MRLHYTREPNVAISHAVNHKDKYWDPRTVFTYSFVGGTNSQRAYVRQGIQRILREVPGLKIQEVATNGLVRIGFDTSLGSWSYVGTDVRLIPTSQTTMNIGWFNDTNQRNVVHEWLHTLNFAHEHIRGINFDKPKLYAAFARIGWSKATVDRNFFNYVEEDYDATEIDNDSIMKYYIDCDWTLDGLNCGTYNTEISETDIRILNEMFPEEDDNPEEPTTNNTDVVKIFKELFPSERSLEKMYESQVVIVAQTLGIEASIDDLKADTIEKILRELA